MKLNNVYALLIIICCMAIPNVNLAQEQASEVTTGTENQDPPPEEDKYNNDESGGDGGGGGYSSGTIFQDSHRKNPTINADSPPDPNDIPIDGGVSILLAAGIGYGLKKYRESMRRIAV